MRWPIWIESRSVARPAASGQRPAQIGRVPALAVHAQRRMRVLGHRLDGDAAHLVERLAAQHRTRAAEEGRVPEVVAGLDQAVEELAFVGHPAEGAEIALERIRRIEVMRRLQHAELAVAQEPADGHLQERARRDVVAVEDGDQLALGDRQRVIDVAGLGVLVGRPDQVAATRLLGEALELRPTSVVEDVDLELVGGVIHDHRRQHGRLHDVEAFVVGRDIDVDRRPLLDVGGQRRRLAVERPQDLEVADHQHDPGIDLGGVEAVAEHHVERVDEAQRLGRSPPQVPGRHESRQHDDDQGRHAALEAVHEYEDEGREDREDGLRLQIERRDDDEGRRPEGNERDEQVEKPRGDRDSPVRGWLDSAGRGHLCSGSMPSRSSPCTDAARPRTSAAALLVGARSITSCWWATASPKLSS